MEKYAKNDYHEYEVYIKMCHSVSLASLSKPHDAKQ